MDPNWRPSKDFARAAHDADYLADILDGEPTDLYWIARHLTEEESRTIRRIGWLIKKMGLVPSTVEELRDLIEKAVEERAKILARQTRGKPKDWLWAARNLDWQTWERIKTAPLPNKIKAPQSKQDIERLLHEVNKAEEAVTDILEAAQ